jgi:hypothetical protein
VMKENVLTYIVRTILNKLPSTKIIRDVFLCRALFSYITHCNIKSNSWMGGLCLKKPYIFFCEVECTYNHIILFFNFEMGRAGKV